MESLLEKRGIILERTSKLFKRVQLAAAKYDEYQKAYAKINENEITDNYVEKQKIIKRLRDFYCRMFRATLKDYNDCIRKNAENSEVLFCFSKNESNTEDKAQYYNYLDDTFFTHYGEDGNSLLKAIDISDFVNYIEEEEPLIRELIASLVNYVIMTYSPQSFLELHILIETILNDARKKGDFNFLEEIKRKTLPLKKQEHSIKY